MPPTASITEPTPKGPQLRHERGWGAAFADWVDSTAEALVRAGQAVEDGLHRMLGPLADELRSVGDDLEGVAAEAAARRANPLPRSGRFEWKSLQEIFGGEEQKEQLATLDEDHIVPASREVAATARTLVIGAATVIATLASSLLYPFSLLFGLAGLVYQVVPIFRDAYRSLVQERRLSFHVISSLMFVLAFLSGSTVALTVSVFLVSLLRWLIAKTERVVQRGVARIFAIAPKSVWLLRDEVEVEVSFAQLAIGDILVVGAGNMIPVDGVIRRGFASVDQHVLTGEARPLDRGPGDPVLACTMVLRGRIFIEVSHSGDGTVAAQLARVLSDTKQYKEQMRSRVEQRQDRLALPILGLGAVAGGLWGLNSAAAVLRSNPGFRMMFFGPLTMLSFMHVASRKGILLKSGQALELLRDVDTVIFDKTGTLTLERPRVGQIFCFAALTELEVLTITAAAEREQTHPIALALKRLVQERRLVLPQGNVTELSVGFGVRILIAGRQVLVGSERLMTMSNITLGSAALQLQDQVHERGNSLIFVAQDDELVGAIELCPDLRPEAAALIAELQRRGKEVIVLSGDHLAPTRSLAAQLGVNRYVAQALPEDKARFVNELRAAGKVVCFVGDGINDSLALRQADVSVSIKGATSLATNVAQVVLMSGDLQLLGPLFDMAERFEHYMRINRLANSIPAFFVLGGTLFFGWSFATAVLVSQVSSPFAFYSLLGPVAEYKAALPASAPVATDET